MILNKKGLDNLTIDMADMQDVEITTEFLIVGFTNRSGGEERVLGFFIHDGPAGTRESNSLLIKRCWENIMENGGSQSRTEMQGRMEGTAPIPGQRLSMSDLFGRQPG